MTKGILDTATHQIPRVILGEPPPIRLIPGTFLSCDDSLPGPDDPLRIASRSSGKRVDICPAYPLGCVQLISAALTFCYYTN